jgi:hypothetical protein
MRKLRIILIILSLFVALSAIWGGLSLILTNGSWIPTSFLEGSPFSNYIIPGLILLFVIGGIQIFAVVWQWKVRYSAPIVSAISGFSLLIWIFTELYILRHPHFLQITFFGIATLILILVILQLSNKNY